MAAPFIDYANEVAAVLRQGDLRVDVDAGDNRMNAKIRNAQTAKVPYMLIVGEKEKEAHSVSVRLRDGKQINGVQLDEFAASLQEKVATRAVDLAISSS